MQVDPETGETIVMGALGQGGGAGGGAGQSYLTTAATLGVSAAWLEGSLDLLAAHEAAFAWVLTAHKALHDMQAWRIKHYIIWKPCICLL